MKSRDGKSQRREEKKKEDQKRESLRRKKIQVCEKVGKSQNSLFFQWFVAPGGRKVGSLKRRVRSQLTRWEMKNCTPLWREAHFEVKMYKAPQPRSTFRSCAVEKVHAVVARNTFPSQNVQNTPCSDHFWKLRCLKSARRCGAKHISKSTCTKHRGSDHFWTFRCCFAWQAQGIVHLVKVSKTWGFCSIFNYSHHYTTLHSNTLHFTSLQLHLHYIPLHYTPIHSTTLHYTQLHSITFNYTQLHYTTLHYITLDYTTTTTTTTTTLH